MYPQPSYAFNQLEASFGQQNRGGEVPSGLDVPAIALLDSLSHAHSPLCALGPWPVAAW